MTIDTMIFKKILKSDDLILKIVYNVVIERMNYGGDWHKKTEIEHIRRKITFSNL